MRPRRCNTRANAIEAAQGQQQQQQHAGGDDELHATSMQRVEPQLSRSCSVCLSGDEEADGGHDSELTPRRCACAGTQGWAHDRCIMHWLSSQQYQEAVRRNAVRGDAEAAAADAAEARAACEDEVLTPGCWSDLILATGMPLHASARLLPCCVCRHTIQGCYTSVACTYACRLLNAMLSRMLAALTWLSILALTGALGTLSPLWATDMFHVALWLAAVAGFSVLNTLHGWWLVEHQNQGSCFALTTNPHKLYHAGPVALPWHARAAYGAHQRVGFQEASGCHYTVWRRQLQAALRQCCARTCHSYSFCVFVVVHALLTEG